MLGEIEAQPRAPKSARWALTATLEMKGAPAVELLPCQRLSSQKPSVKNTLVERDQECGHSAGQEDLQWPPPLPTSPVRNVHAKMRNLAAGGSDGFPQLPFLASELLF